MGLGTRDIQIALITAMVESNLVNVHYGDSDSLGLFQQRPSQGWGTPEQVMDPEYAAKQFFIHLKGLGSSRFQMGMGEAAQAVQRSAFPDRYAQQIPSMRNLWPSAAAGAGDAQMTMDGQPYMGVNPDMMQPDMLGVGSTSMGIPSASSMLGAWGMDAPKADPFMDGATSLLSQGTNQWLQGQLGQGGSFQQGVDGWRGAVISAARSALGTPYTWGGNSLANGVDCSGLIQQAFAKAGIELPRVSYQQANQGTQVGFKGLQAGDLVAWDNSSRNNGADHIAIYLGNGMIIEAPRPGLSVRIRRIGHGLDGGFGVHLNF